MCALVVATPFETRNPVVTLPYQQLTLTEFVWLAAALCWAGSYAARRQMPAWRTPVTAPWLTWMAVMLLAAFAADAERANAVKTVGRLIVFGVTGWMVSTSVTSAKQMALLLSIAAGTGVVVAVVAVLEVWRVAPVVAVLEALGNGVRVVGGEVRASSTLQYPTITAMYLELVLCGALGILLWMVDRGGWRMASAALAGVLVLIVGLTLTLTRAAVLAALCGTCLAAWWRFRQKGPDRGFVLVVVCGLCIVAAPLVLASSDVALARWTTDGRQGWYVANFDAPQAITGRPGELVRVPVTVMNRGRITWSSEAVPPFYVSYHWVEAATPRIVLFEGVRTRLPADVPPGGSLPLSVDVRFPPKAGSYRLTWDVVQEDRLWFVGEPGARLTFTGGTVLGDPVPFAEGQASASKRSPTELPMPMFVPGRPALWRAAVRMAGDHPWLGVGPDNFRLRSGAYLPGAEPNPRVHSNNLYLEVLTGGGVFAGAAFLWFVWRVAGVIAVQGKRLTGQAAAAYAGVAAAGTAYLAHGFLDSFLTFTPTAFASAVILGLAIAPSQWSEGSPL